jgi:hypothetical protein
VEQAQVLRKAIAGAKPAKRKAGSESKPEAKEFAKGSLSETETNEFVAGPLSETKWFMKDTCRKQNIL